MIATLTMALVAVCLFVLLPCIPASTPKLRFVAATMHTVVALLALWCWYQWQLTDVTGSKRALGMTFVAIIVFFADYNLAGSAPKIHRRTPMHGGPAIRRV